MKFTVLNKAPKSPTSKVYPDSVVVLTSSRYMACHNANLCEEYCVMDNETGEVFQPANSKREETVIFEPVLAEVAR